jgi:hypothetical protein
MSAAQIDCQWAEVRNTHNRWFSAFAVIASPKSPAAATVFNRIACEQRCAGQGAARDGSLA